MQIEYIPIKDIIPYENNPRKNKKAIGAVKKSIKEFGFKVPLVVDKDNVIVTGHTRYSASKQLGFTELPCIRATDLTDEQIKAFRLVDNKVAEQSSWDMLKLDIEMKDLELNFDMGNFGFDLGEIEQKAFDEDMKSIDTENINSSLQHNCFENIEVMKIDGEGYYDFPVMEASHTVCDKFVRFCDWKDVINENPEDYIAHFFYDDYKFISVWREPDKKLDVLKRFKAVISPDFSLYTDFPKALQILSCYRRQWCGAYWQIQGIDVIPDVIWGEPDTFSWCFDGVPKGGTVAVSSLGVEKNPQWNGKENNLFEQGYNEMLKRLEPETILFYGKLTDGLKGNIIKIPTYYDLKFGQDKGE